MFRIPLDIIFQRDNIGFHACTKLSYWRVGFHAIQNFNIQISQIYNLFTWNFIIIFSLWITIDVCLYKSTEEAHCLPTHPFTMTHKYITSTIKSDCNLAFSTSPGPMPIYKTHLQPTAAHHVLIILWVMNLSFSFADGNYQVAVHFFFFFWWTYSIIKLSPRDLPCFHFAAQRSISLSFQCYWFLLQMG